MSAPDASDNPTLKSAIPHRSRRGSWLGYVVLATSFLCVVQPLFELTHYSWVRNSRWEDWTIRLYLLFESIAAVGGVVLATRDRNLWWLLATLVAIVAPVLMIVWISQMVPVTLR